MLDQGALAPLGTPPLVGTSPLWCCCPTVSLCVFGVPVWWVWFPAFAVRTNGSLLLPWWPWLAGFPPPILRRLRYNNHSSNMKRGIGAVERLRGLTSGSVAACEGPQRCEGPPGGKTYVELEGGSLRHHIHQESARTACPSRSNSSQAVWEILAAVRPGRAGRYGSWAGRYGTAVVDAGPDCRPHESRTVRGAFGFAVSPWLA